MTYTNASFWICTFLFALFSIDALAQDTLGWNYAHQLYQKGAYQSAGIEFERIIYQTNHPEWQAKASLQKANCYKQMGLFWEGQKCLEKVNLMFLNDTFHYNVHHQAALCAYLGERWNDAEGHLVQMENFVKDSNLLAKSTFLKVLVYNEQARWAEAKEILLKWAVQKGKNTAERDSLKALVEANYTKRKIPRLKNAKAADRMSTIVPGLGQTYLGYPHEGALSFLLVASSLTFAFYYSLWLEATYVTTFTVGSYFIQSFYYGNIRRTAFLAEKRNYKLTRKFNDPARQLVLALQHHGS
ncbi:MAG: hypothetical protein ACFB10_01860 [Salibacteraceae bacterium]